MNRKLKIIVEEMLGGFYDTSYAYKFGPPKHEVACATLKDRSGKIISQQFHFPVTHHLPMVEANVVAEFSENKLSISSDKFLYGVQIQSEIGLPEDNYFHLMPNEKREIKFNTDNIKSNIQINSINLKNIARATLQ